MPRTRRSSRCEVGRTCQGAVSTSWSMMGSRLKLFPFPPTRMEFARERCADVGVLGFWCSCGIPGRERRAEIRFPVRGICRNSVSRTEATAPASEQSLAPPHQRWQGRAMHDPGAGAQGRLRDDGGRPRVLALTQHQHSGAGRNALKQAGILVISEVCACPGSTNASSES